MAKLVYFNEAEKYYKLIADPANIINSIVIVS